MKSARLATFLIQKVSSDESILLQKISGDGISYAISDGINKANNSGETALSYAIKFDMKNVAKLLIQEMSVCAINKDQTALHYAEEKGWVDVVESIKHCLPKDSFSREGGEMHGLMDGDSGHKISGMHQEFKDDLGDV